MGNMQNIQAIENLDDMTGIIKNELDNITEGFIAVGYYLRKTMDDGLYRQKGYASIYEYAKQTFGISRPTAIRFMEINEKYSIGGYSPQIEDKWRNYGSSKLTEMLGLPEEIREEVPIEATVRDIREVKGVIRETVHKYDDQMELCDIEQDVQETEEETDWLQKLVREFFREQKQVFEKMVDWVRKGSGENGEDIEEDVLEIVNPTKFRMVRLDTANVLMQEKCIRVMPYRGQGEVEEYDYVQLAADFEELFYPNYPDISAPIQKVYEDVYNVPLYEERQPSEKEQKTEKAEEKQEKKEGKKEPEVLVNTRPETELKENGEIKGQTELTKDFPEYCPDVPETREKESKEMGTEEKKQKVESFYKSRKTYMDSLSEEEIETYMAAVMEKLLKRMRNVSIQVLTTAEFWKTFYEKEVDEKGDEVECVN